MKAIKVEYRVRADFAETNKQNIQKVMEDLQALGDTGVMYSAYTKADGLSFVHIVFQRDEEAAQIVPNLESFKAFQAALKTGLEIKPEAQTLELVGKSFSLA